MARARLSALWDHTDPLLCAIYNSRGLAKPVPAGYFHPFRTARRLQGNDLNHETAPHLYYRG